MKSAQLEALNVIGCGDIIDYAVCALANNCNSMRAIDLAGHYLLTDASVSLLFPTVEINVFKFEWFDPANGYNFRSTAEIAQKCKL